jgi:uncharacterized membrane protein YphA (DoxX/SURF4 family)
MFDRIEALSDLGRVVYGLAGIALGVIGLVWGDYAAVWQPIDNLIDVPDRTLLASVFAVCELSAGAATLWRRTARFGVLALAALYLICAVGWIPRIIGNPGIYGVWNGFFEQFALVAAGVVAYASLSVRAPAWKARAIQTGCFLFGICAVSFALGHFTAIPETAGFVPKWIPGQRLWAWATGAFHLFAGIAIVSGVMAVLASRSLTAMMVGFGALVWAPALFVRPNDHFTWAGNAINFALVGAAWVIADQISRRRKQSESQHDRPPADAAAQRLSKHEEPSG